MLHSLIIEDNPALRTLTRDILAAENFSVDTAGSGEEGRDKIEKTPPDLLVLDLGLPDDFGLDICRDVKKNYPNTIVFIITALGN